MPRDILKLETGDIVPADVVIRHCLNLRVDETTFTGESIPVAKIATESATPTPENILLQGVTIICGIAFVEVTATGVQTKFAQIAKTVEIRLDFNNRVSQLEVRLVSSALG